MPILHKLIQGIGEWGALPGSLDNAGIPLPPKTDKGATNKTYRSIFFININAKSLKY